MQFLAPLYLPPGQKKSGVSGDRCENCRVVQMQFIYVAEFVQRRAAGVCELCEEDAPFEDLDGEPFLEEHHIKWLSRGGKDTTDNAVALCPNCHRKMHIRDLVTDRAKLFSVAKKTEPPQIDGV